MSERRRTSAISIAVLVALSALAGGLAALGIATAAGWVGGTDTVVVERAETVPTQQPRGLGVAKPLTRERFDPAGIYRERATGVVTIFALFPGHQLGDTGAQAQGSGFVVSAQGHILTNSHVITTAGEGTSPSVAVEGAAKVYVEFADGDRVDAKIVGWDLFDDVGVLKVDAKEHVLAPVPLGDSSSVVVGQPVAAIGSPFDQPGSLTVGVVSATQRSVGSLTSSYAVVDAIQIDAPINRGNSGGPLFNARGEVIGINAQIRSESGNAEGVGFAVPIDLARRSMEQLIQGGSVRYAWAGIATQDLTPSLADALDLSVERGAAIQRVEPGSPADKAGLRGGGEQMSVKGLDFVAGGDVVVAINGRRIQSTEDLVRIVAGQLVPGETARFTVVRDGKEIVVSVVLAQRPADPDAGR